MSATTHPSISARGVADSLHAALYASATLVILAERRDGGWMIVQANPAAERAVGEAAALAGQGLASLEHPDTDPASFAALMAACEAGGAHHVQLCLGSPTGRPAWFALHVLPMPAGVLILGHDVTAERRHREQDQAAQALLAKVFVTVDAPVYIADQQGRFLMTNPAFDRLAGVPLGSLIGRSTLEAYTEASRAILAAGRSQHTLEGLEFGLEVALRRPGGVEVPCRLKAVVMQRPDLLRFRIVAVTPTGGTGAIAAAAPTQPAPLLTAAGRIQLIGLDEVRQSLGPRWDAVRDRALATAEHVLRRCLGPHDTFSATEDGGYVVCFADASEEEASFRAATIGREIRRRLIGEGQTPEAAHVFSAAVALPPTEAALPALELAALVQSRVEQRMRGIQETARARLIAALETAAYDTQPVHARDRAEAIGWCVRLPAGTRAAIEVATAALPQAETAALDPDTMLLGFAQECALQHALHAPGQFVFVTLSPEVLLVRRRMEACLAACRAMSERVRQQLVLVLSAPPDGAARQLGNGLPKLRAVCRMLGVATETLEAADLELRDLGLHFVLVDAAIAQKGKIKARADHLHVHRCRLLLCDAAADQAASLFAEGADFVAHAAARA